MELWSSLFARIVAVTILVLLKGSSITAGLDMVAASLPMTQLLRSAVNLSSMTRVVLWLGLNQLQRQLQILCTRLFDRLACCRQKALPVLRALCLVLIVP